MSIQVEVDDEVLGHLLIARHREGGTFSDVIRTRLDATEPQLKLPFKKEPKCPPQDA